MHLEYTIVLGSWEARWIETIWFSWIDRVFLRHWKFITNTYFIHIISTLGWLWFLIVSLEYVADTFLMTYHLLLYWSHLWLLMSNRTRMVITRWLVWFFRGHWSGRPEPLDSRHLCLIHLLYDRCSEESTRIAKWFFPRVQVLLLHHICFIYCVCKIILFTYLFSVNLKIHTQFTIWLIQI